MSWQDREYAREPGRRSVMSWGPRRGPSWLLGGSIITTIIAVNVAIFVLGWFFPGVHRFLYGYQAGNVIYPGIFEIRPIQIMHGELWRLVTAQYLHAGPMHIFFNMFVLHVLGRPVEQIWSARRFFAIYTMCGLVGNLFYAILGQYGIIFPASAAVGASGSIYGIIGVIAVMFPRATVHVYFILPVKMRTFAIVLGAIAFLTVATRGQNFGGEACHLAGMLFGAWWAWKGDKWWNATEWTFLPRKGHRRQTAKGSGAWQRKMDDVRADEETVDKILAKVREQGIHALSNAEKRALESASERLKKRDNEA